MKEKKSFAQRVHLMIREIVNHSADEKSHIPFSGGSDALPVAVPGSGSEDAGC